MKLAHLIQELSIPMDKRAFSDRAKWAAAAASVSGQSSGEIGDVVKVGDELVARWRESTQTGWVQQKSLHEKVEGSEGAKLTRELSAALKDLEDLPQSPTSQEGYDARDDAQQKVKTLRAKLASLKK